MKAVLFLLYYCQLRFGVFFGLRRTYYPLNIKWRWRYWLHRNKLQHHTYKKKNFFDILRTDIKVLTKTIFD